ncbi:hypothetical protein ISF26_08565 [Gloeobacter morelensis MG652769]|uniref:Uncharacterized protein n=1 Tax=Gloeobacter morelensis MG652769 TaxID=2781736 RepID=A0ABY3PRC0_9CYAN|nr:hypothetical protein ISF26_08565 [Gloeobacter morelensis MG652769]
MALSQWLRAGQNGCVPQSPSGIRSRGWACGGVKEVKGKQHHPSEAPWVLTRVEQICVSRLLLRMLFDWHCGRIEAAPLLLAQGVSTRL